jgi:signal peptidase I
MDFALIMLLALGVTGFIWGADRAFAHARRVRAAVEIERTGGEAAAIERARKEPVLVEYARAFFPVILIVFLIRSFLVEPFRIPSGSMLPSLLIGDFILVNKYAYGVRVPVLNRKILDVGSPRRGDVMVFRYPGDPSTNYIKRVIGLPGDFIRYDDKNLYVNGRPMTQRADGEFGYTEGGMHPVSAGRRTENLDGVEHSILVSDVIQQPPFEYRVPEGNYFVMGDNRDRSNDSRYWGPVPEANIVGKAFLIWFNLDLANGGGVIWNRIGNRIN